MKQNMIKNIFQRLVNPRQYWEGRAKALRDTNGGWYVGRIDMRSCILVNDVRLEYIHYAYPPDNGERIPFFRSPVSALRRAVKYAERKNKQMQW